MVTPNPGAAPKCQPPLGSGYQSNIMPTIPNPPDARSEAVYVLPLEITVASSNGPPLNSALKPEPPIIPANTKPGATAPPIAIIPPAPPPVSDAEPYGPCPLRVSSVGPVVSRR